MPPKNQVVIYAPPSGRGSKKNKRKKSKTKVQTLAMVSIPRRRKPKTKTPRMLGGETAVRQYMLAMRNPFSPDALGVRVVDSVCINLS